MLNRGTCQPCIIRFSGPVASRLSKIESPEGEPKNHINEGGYPPKKKQKIFYKKFLMYSCMHKLQSHSKELLSI